MLIPYSQVYSPHTAIDAAPGGLGDWLADIVTGTLPNPEPATRTAHPEISETNSMNTDSSNNQDESKKDPLVEQSGDGKDNEDEKTPQHKRLQRPRMSLQRTYSKPTYPTKPSEPEKTDLDLTPYVFSLVF